MSTTNIFQLGSEPGEIASIRNAWRGAMYVWTDMAKRYWKLEQFPLFGDGEQSKIWNTHKHHKIPEHERIVLLSTMDGAVVFGRDAKTVADAFARYAQEHPESSLAEQAEILRTSEVPPNDAFAWQQTSVGDFWGSNWDEAAEDTVWYDLQSGTKHFDVCAHQN